MAEIISQYSVGDWVVHYSYGIGQIQKIEEKPIHGELAACFQVKAQNGAQWWFPNNGVDNPRIRPVASQDMLERALKELQKPGKELDPDKNLWKKHIEEVKSSGDYIATAQILRDLTILRTQRKLNQIEVKALSLFQDRILMEWSTTMNINIEAIRPKLKDYLQVYEEHGAAG